MAKPSAIVAAVKAVPGGARYTPAPQGSGWGKVSPLAAELMNGSNNYSNTYGPFLPRPSGTFTDGAFSPMSPINPVPVDNPPFGGLFAEPRLWQPRVGWNLPTPPGTEGLKLASFDQLRTLAQKYSVARACIELRKKEILSLEWEITLTTDAAKAYKGSSKLMRDFGVRKAQATKFFRRPDPDFWSFGSFLEAMLEEIFVYDALSIVFRPKYGQGLGRGLLGSDLDHLKLINGPTIRPLLGLHGEHPLPPAPAYQQYLFGVPRSDYMSIQRGTDIDDAGLTGSEITTYRSDVLLYAPVNSVRDSPYGFPPVERALLPIISGLQKQEFQLDYFTEGSVPAVYISPGDPNITPTQIRELQDALNAIAGDPAYHMKVVVLPPGSKVEPQRPVDLSDSFDELIMNQVCMAFDVQPTELGIIPAIGGGQQGPSASALRMAAQASRDIRERKSTKPLLMFIADIFNHVIQDMCGQTDMRFEFEGLVDDEDKEAITNLGVQQVQNGISSIDEVRERLDLPPWGLDETSEPVVFTAQGPIPFSMAPQLIMAAAQGNQQQGSSSSSGSKGKKKGSQGTNSGQKTSSTQTRSKQPTVRRGGQTKPNGSHPAPVSPHRESATPAHAAASGAIQSPTPRTGGTRSRSPVAGSRKKAATAELEALRRHLHKGRDAASWEARWISGDMHASLIRNLNKGIPIDVAIQRLLDDEILKGKPDWPGWEHDLGLVGRYKQEIGDAFHNAEVKAEGLRKDAATGKMWVSPQTLKSLINEEMKEVFLGTLNPLWTEAWHLGYAAAKSLVQEVPADFTVKRDSEHLQAFLDTEGQHWLEQISRTGLGNNSTRCEIIARTEVARAINTAALQCYKDNGIAYKHLLLSPNDTCDICKGAEADGVIPLDASFSAGGTLGFCHPQCRCVPAPAGVNVLPPMGHMGKSADFIVEDPSQVAFILMRSRNADGKWVYLLQKRGEDTNNPGTWGLPGGTSHVGESPWQTAVREVAEEMGDFPVTPPKVTLSRQDDDRMVHIFLCEVDDPFTPLLNGATSHETAGYGWFRKKEIGELDLQPNFRDQWTTIDWHEVAKSLSVNENGERSDIQRGPGKPNPTGGNWPTPHRVDGTQEEWPNAGPGAVDDEHGSAGGEPPLWMYGSSADLDDWSSAVNTLLAPMGGDDSSFPKDRGTPASRRGNTPSGGASAKPGKSPQEIAASSTGADTGVPPSGKGMGKPVVGSVPAKTPQPMKPGSVPPQTFDPDETVEHWSPEDESNTMVPLPVKKKGTGGPADYSDANPVDAEHVMNLMRSNFPEDAIQWVKRARWIGPVQVPWDRVDDDDIDEWAASHQPNAVNRFARDIMANRGHTNPSILVQEPNSNRAFIVDGHHRALARRKLNQPVLAYIGNIDPKDRQAALETHSLQVHSGKDPKNK